MNTNTKSERVLIAYGFISSLILGAWGLIAFPKMLAGVMSIPVYTTLVIAIFLVVFFLLTALLFSFLAFITGSLSGVLIFERWRDYVKRLAPFLAILVFSYVVISLLAGLLAAGIGPALEEAYSYSYARSAVALISAAISVPASPIVLTLYLGYTGTDVPIREMAAESMRLLRKTYLKLLLLSAVIYAAGFLVFAVSNQISQESIRTALIIVLCSILGSISVYVIYRVFKAATTDSSIEKEERKAIVYCSDN